MSDIDATIMTQADLLNAFANIPTAAPHTSNRRLIRNLVISIPDMGNYYPVLGGEVGVTDRFKHYNDPRRFGWAAGAPPATNVLAINNAFTSGYGQLIIPPGTFQVNDEFNPPSNWEIRLSAGTTITQITAGKGVWATTSRDNVWIHYMGGQIMGPGVWSNLWNGVAGHEERGEKWYGCTRSGSTFARVRNFGLAGIAILGGDITCLAPVVEGTHALGSVLSQGASYQFAYLIMHDTTYGACTRVKIISPEGYNVNFGVNTLDNVAAGGSTGRITLSNAYFHDIIGQHAGYISTSFTDLPGFVAVRCGLDGCKFFSGVANEQLTNITGTFDISDCVNGQALEIGISGTGHIRNSFAHVVARNCSRIGTVDGDARHVKLTMLGENILQRAFYVAQGSGVGPTDNEWDVNVDGCVEKGVLIAASTSDRNILRFKGRRVSTGGGGHWAVGVNTCAGLTIERLEAFDDLGHMTFGLYNEVGANNVRLNCTPVIQGYITNAVRSDSLSFKWEGSGGEYTNLQTAFFGQGNNVIPVAPLSLGRQTTVNANVPLWQLTMPDNSIYKVKIDIVGLNSGGAECRSTTLVGTFRRTAGGACVQVGATTVVNNDVSAGFTGTTSFSPTVNDVRVIVNSPSANVIDWRCEVSVVRMF